MLPPALVWPTYGPIWIKNKMAGNAAHAVPLPKFDDLRGAAGWRRLEVRCDRALLAAGDRIRRADLSAGGCSRILGYVLIQERKLSTERPQPELPPSLPPSFPPFPSPRSAQNLKKLRERFHSFPPPFAFPNKPTPHDPLPHTSYLANSVCSGLAGILGMLSMNQRYKTLWFSNSNVQMECVMCSIASLCPCAKS